MPAYYNEIDPYAAQWLRNLIAASLIAAGDVDERSIVDVKPDDLRPYTQCHFFAGLGGWSHALRLAGWPDDRPVWTGSCPCQPFSVAGSGKGTADERHLWPVWYNLIKECQPTAVFGEQVEAAIRFGWLDLVQDDLENSGYTFGAICLPAACTGAPHIRQRAWFVADSSSERCNPGRNAHPEYEWYQLTAGSQVPSGQLANAQGSEYSRNMDRPAEQCGAGFTDNGHMGNTIRPGLERHTRDGASSNHRPEQTGSTTETGISDLLAHTNRNITHSQNPSTDSGNEKENRSTNLTGGRGLSPGGFWESADWLYCRDGKYRPVEPGTFPLAHGATARVGRLCAYGNAIVPQVAAEVISAYMAWRAA